MPLALVLFSGGLDSMLAVRLLQEQGFEVEALTVHTVFRCCKPDAERAAAELGVRWTLRAVDDDYLDVIRRPRFGYGKGMNPCVDCRIYMARLARERMVEIGACVVVTGDVLGQREMSQKRVDLDRMAHHAGLEGRLLCPLSARLLAPTLVEREGQVDRSRLYAFNGRGRKGLIELGKQLGIRAFPSPSNGCPLVEKQFASKVRDLLSHNPGAARWEFELLSVGRHLRLGPTAKVVLGRNQQEDEALANRFERSSDAILLVPESFTGPTALVIGPPNPDLLRTAGAIMLRYSKATGPQEVRVQRSNADPASVLRIEPMTIGELPLL